MSRRSFLTPCFHTPTTFSLSHFYNQHLITSQSKNRIETLTVSPSSLFSLSNHKANNQRHQKKNIKQTNITSTNPIMPPTDQEAVARTQDILSQAIAHATNASSDLSKLEALLDERNERQTTDEATLTTMKTIRRDLERRVGNTKPTSLRFTKHALQNLIRQIDEFEPHVEERRCELEDYWRIYRKIQRDVMGEMNVLAGLVRSAEID